MTILTIRAIKGIIKEPRSRGISGALYLQSAIAGVMAGRGLYACIAALYKWR